MEKIRFNTDDLKEQLRIQGYVKTDDIQFAILETNGQLSIIPKPKKQQSTVEDVKKDAILGLCVTIQCDEGISLIYQSLANVQLEEGQTVRQGDVLGQSGYNVYEAELGNHVHFTIEKDNEPINPLTVIKS